MFKPIHNIQSKIVSSLQAHARRKLSSRRGQTAIVMILIIAIALVIYAASLNWGRVTQYKTLTIVSSNQAAANMASIISSYGEQHLQVTLGGRPEYCKRTNFLVLLATIIIAVVLLVLVIVSWGAALPLLIIAIAALVLAIAAMVINLVVIQPGLVSMWNKMQDALLTMEDKVVENGIMTALQSVVTDPQNVQDHRDMDLDGLWVNDKGVSNLPTPPDKISRFAYYYTMRLMTLEPVRIPEVDYFVTSLNEFIYDNPYGKLGPPNAGPPPTGCTAAEFLNDPNALVCQVPDHWGIYDPGCASGKPSPWCNPCCQPEKDGDGKQLRPKSCGAGFLSADCSPADGYYPSAVYPFQYDPYYENYTNEFLSFREKLGMDDENTQYVKDPPAVPNDPKFPNGLQSLAPPPPAFIKEDSTGFYPPPSEGGKELKKGVFPFFWEMGYLMPAIAIIPPAPIPALPLSDQVTIVTDMRNVLIPPTNRFRTPDDMCALDQWDKDDKKPKGFWWKPGIDHYCSTKYPYNDCASRSGSCQAGSFDGSEVPTCGCTAASVPDARKEWHEDPVDYMVDGLTAFISWSEKIIKSYNDKKSSLMTTFTEWYPGAAYWIAPKCKAAWLCNSDASNKPVQCLTCNNTGSDNQEGNDGYLIMWRDQLLDWLYLLDPWLYGRSSENNNKYSFSDPNTLGNPNGLEAWCLPNQANTLPSAEYNYIMQDRLGQPIPLDLLGNPMWYIPQEGLDPPAKDALGYPIPVDELPWGDLDDTIACLKFNQKNEIKFNKCYIDCTTLPLPASTVDNCINLPRSAIADFANVSFDGPYRNAQQLQDCLNSTCQSLEKNPKVLNVCKGLNGLGVTVAPDCTNWPNNAFYNDVKAQRNVQFNQSQVCNSASGISTLFQDNLKRSADAAAIQVTTPVNGFIDRHDKLFTVRKRTRSARDVFLEGFKKFDEFLMPCGGKLDATGKKIDPGDNCAKGCKTGGPAAQLMCARENFTDHTNQLPNFVIYGWKSPPNPLILPRSNPTMNGQGYWHIVRIETFAPKRCFGTQWCHTDEYPKVKTWIKWKFSPFTMVEQFQCYKLIKTEGRVISRVTRYDEDQDTPGAKFANGHLIWKFRFNNPGSAPSQLAQTGPSDLGSLCSPPPAYWEGASQETKNFLGEAFMINDTPWKKKKVQDKKLQEGKLNPNENTDLQKMIDCWNKVNALLDTGVQTTTCAWYFLDKSITHMNLKFTQCPKDVDALFECAKKVGSNGECKGP